jgi:hypothetical protein
MKRLFLQILCFTLSSCYLLSFSGNGSGTESDPYQITNIEQLQEMNDELDAHYKLMNDIDASDTENWNDGEGFDPVGDRYYQFSGTFNGNNYSISNLYINRPDESYIGLFGYNQAGIGLQVIIKNVKVVDCDIYGKSYVGAIIGYFNAVNQQDPVDQNMIINCKVTGQISSVRVSLGGTVGGIAGYNRMGIILYCTSNVELDGRSFIGGISGSSGGIVAACSSYGAIDAELGLVGGISGYNGGTIYYSFSEMDISAGGSKVGGLVGDNTGATIHNCYARGSLTKTSTAYFFGGLVGYFSGEIINCYSTGSVPENEGGLIGDKAPLDNPYSSYWDINTSGAETSDGGTGKTTSQMKTQSTFVNWDFDEIWNIDGSINDGYPYLRIMQEETINPPSNLRAILVDHQRILMAWNEVEGATNYRLYRSTEPNGEYTQIYWDSDNTYNDIGDHLTPGTTYYYKVRAENDDGISAYSDYVAVELPDYSEINGTVLNSRNEEAIEGALVTLYYSSIKIYVDQVETNEDGEFVFEELPYYNLGAPYSIKVEKEGYSTWTSLLLSLDDWDESYNNTIYLDPYASNVNDLSYEEDCADPDYLRLFWEIPEDSYITHYKLERREDNISWTTLNDNISGTSTEYIDEVTSGSYFYRLTALNEDLPSNSQVLSVEHWNRKPSPVKNFKGLAQEDPLQINLSFDLPDNLTGACSLVIKMFTNGSWQSVANIDLSTENPNNLTIDEDIEIGKRYICSAEIINANNLSSDKVYDEIETFFETQDVTITVYEGNTNNPAVGAKVKYSTDKGDNWTTVNTQTNSNGQVTIENLPNRAYVRAEKRYDNEPNSVKHPNVEGYEKMFELWVYSDESDTNCADEDTFRNISCEKEFLPDIYYYQYGNSMTLRLKHPVMKYNMIVYCDFQPDKIFEFDEDLYHNFNEDIDAVLETLFKKTSKYMYDVTDGYAMLNKVRVYWDENEIISDIMIKNQNHNPISATDGIAWTNESLKYLGVTISVTYDENNLFEDIDIFAKYNVHEYGHYIWGLLDEYENKNKKKIHNNSRYTDLTKPENDIPYDFGLMDDLGLWMSSNSDYPQNFRERDIEEQTEQYCIRISPCWSTFQQEYLLLLFSMNINWLEIQTPPEDNYYDPVIIGGRRLNLYGDYHYKGPDIKSGNELPGGFQSIPNNKVEKKNDLVLKKGLNTKETLLESTNEIVMDVDASTNPGNDSLWINCNIIFEAAPDSIPTVNIISNKNIFESITEEIDDKTFNSTFIFDENDLIDSEGEIQLITKANEKIDTIYSKYKIFFLNEVMFIDNQLLLDVDGEHGLYYGINDVDSNQIAITHEMLCQPAFNDNLIPASYPFGMNFEKDRILPDTLYISKPFNDDIIGINRDSLKLFYFDFDSKEWVDFEASYASIRSKYVYGSNLSSGLFCIMAESLSDDTSSPVRINDLTAQTGLGEAIVNLTFAKAAEDDTDNNIEYVIRYSEQVITDNNWESANLLQYYKYEDENKYITDVTMPESDKLYYFAMKLVDKSGNISELSNIALAFSGPETVFEENPQQDSTFIWAKQGISEDDSEGYAITSDNQGNVYITGRINSTVTFTDEIVIETYGGNDIFLAKYSDDGTCIWAINAGGVSNDIGYGISCDNQGNIFLTGFISGEVTFNGDIQIFSNGSRDVFIAKYNLDGECLWAVNAGGFSFDEGYGINVDSQGFIYITGYFLYNAYFGDDIQIEGNNMNDIFLAKYDQTGDCIWATPITSNYQNIGQDIDIDRNNNVYLTGSVQGDVLFNNDISFSTTANSVDFFIAKYNNSGSCLWAKNYGGEDYDKAYSIEIDISNNIFLSGGISDNVVFNDDETISINSYGGRDVFIAKFDQLGNCIWAKNIGSNATDNAYGLEVDLSGNSYIAGFFEDQAIYDGSRYITSFGDRDAFVAKYNDSGDIIAIDQGKSQQNVIFWDICISSNHSLFSTGSFENEVTLGQINLSGNDDKNLLITKIADIDYTINELQIPLALGWNMISSYINPTDINVENLLEPIQENLLLLRNNAGELYFPSLGINTIGNWDIAQGYKAYMMEEATLDIFGTKVVPEETPIELPQGWNWIAYLRDDEMSVVTAFEDIVDEILLVKNNVGNMYFPSLNINSLGNLEPTQGYQIYMMDAATLAYPANGSPRQALKGSELTPKATYIVPEIKRTGNSMSLVIETVDLLNNSEIGIWTSDNVLVGSGKVHYSKAAITVWGDNEQTEDIDGAKQLESLKAMVFDKESAISYEIELANIHSLRTSKNQEYLSFSTEDIIMAKAVNSSINNADDLLLTCKPNPTTGETVIEYSLETNSFVSIKLYSMAGQLIQILTESENTAGFHTLNFDGSRLANGVYNLQMVVDGKSVNRLLVVSR